MHQMKAFPFVLGSHITHYYVNEDKSAQTQ